MTCRILSQYSRSFQNGAQLIMFHFFQYQTMKLLLPWKETHSEMCGKQLVGKCHKRYAVLYSSFSHDIAKMQKWRILLSIFLSFYFHKVLEKLKLRFFKFSLWKGSLFCDRLCLNALHLCGGCDSCHVDLKVTYLGRFCFLNSPTAISYFFSQIV